MAAVAAHLEHTDTQLVICDINMPGANHFGVVKTIKSLRPGAKLLMLSAYNPALYAQRYLEEGADAYLSKSAATAEIGNTILALLRDEKPPADLPEETTGSETGETMQASPLTVLSNRELEVAQLLVDGNGILEIANLLQLHTNTVSTYKTRIFEKMNIASVPELVAVFRQYTNWGLG
jgi:DNA-binding NarL/FixJ family response regulator